ncbi:MAG: arginyltransferase [Planctomycetota bacterium]
MNNGETDEPTDEKRLSRSDRLLAHIDADRLPRTPLFPCPYLPDRQARQRAFLAEHLDPELYHDLMDRGFRRSGEMFYATDCPSCEMCVPLRVPTTEFRPSKSQRRAMQKNRDVVMRVRHPELSTENFDLYGRYVQHQHGTPATDETRESLRASLYERVVDTVEVTYTIGDRLAAVSLLDVCSRSVSAVYHFFEPEFAARSLGVFSVLAEIEWARRIGVPHYYLGYWVEGAETMHYKANYRPHELLRVGAWQRA